MRLHGPLTLPVSHCVPSSGTWAKQRVSVSWQYILPQNCCNGRSRECMQCTNVCVSVVRVCVCVCVCVGVCVVCLGVCRWCVCGVCVGCVCGVCGVCGVCVVCVWCVCGVCVSVVCVCVCVCGVCVWCVCVMCVWCVWCVHVWCVCMCGVCVWCVCACVLTSGVCVMLQKLELDPRLFLHCSVRVRFLPGRLVPLMATVPFTPGVSRKQAVNPCALDCSR